MVDIKTTIKKTGHYPVKDHKTGRISLVRPKRGVDTEEKLEAAVDRFYYENDIEHRNPKNWNPLPRRRRGLQRAEHRASPFHNRVHQNGGDDDDHATPAVGNPEPRGETDPGDQQAHAPPAYFDVNSAETLSQNSSDPSQELEEDVRRMSLRTAPVRHTVEETCSRRWPNPHHAIDQVNSHHTRLPTPQESGHTTANDTKTLFASPYNACNSMQKPPRQHSNRSRLGDPRSPPESGTSSTLQKRRQPQPDHISKGNPLRVPGLVDTLPVQADVGDRRPRNISQSIAPLCQSHQAEIVREVAAQGQRRSNSIKNTGNLETQYQTQDIHAEKAQSAQTAATLEFFSEHDHSTDSRTYGPSRSLRRHRAERSHPEESAEKRPNYPQIHKPGEASHRYTREPDDHYASKTDLEHIESKTLRQTSRVEELRGLEGSHRRSVESQFSRRPPTTRSSLHGSSLGQSSTNKPAISAGQSRSRSRRNSLGAQPLVFASVKPTRASPAPGPKSNSTHNTKSSRTMYASTVHSKSQSKG